MNRLILIFPALVSIMTWVMFTGWSAPVDDPSSLETIMLTGLAKDGNAGLHIALLAVHYIQQRPIAARKPVAQR